MQWKLFQLDGQSYDLAHLHPFEAMYEQPAQKGLPARRYIVDVVFGLHCFTRGSDEDQAVDAKMLYADAREIRVFDFDRYELSKLLPGILRGLGQRRCFHTGRGNFFSIEIVRRDGRVVEYDIFFAVSRSSRKGRINLFVQSGYIRDKTHASNRPATKPISLYVILFNTLNNKPIKVPK